MTPAAPAAAIAVEARRRGPVTVVTELDGTEPWRPRMLPAEGRLARVALVQSRASLLGGDDVSLTIDLGPGCLLEIVELGATIAHHARGGPPTRLSAAVRLGPEARLVWLAEPLIVAMGSDVLRSTRVELDVGAGVLLREAVVLGRAAGAVGQMTSHTSITLEGRPVVEETLSTGPLWLLRSNVVAGPAGMIDALFLAGLRDPDPPPQALQAHGVATLWRGLGPARSHPADAGARLARRWRRLALGAASPAPSAAPVP